MPAYDYRCTRYLVQIACEKYAVERYVNTRNTIGYILYVNQYAV